LFEKTYYATHPDMMIGPSNQDLRDRHLVSNLFRAGSHEESHEDIHRLSGPARYQLDGCPRPRFFDKCLGIRE
jgi:hypothetical protein